jgi:deoxyhypusine synthase
MSAARQRREKAKRIGLKLQSDYRALVEAKGTDAVETAAIMLGGTFNAHIEFIINVLRDYGGLDVKWEPMTAITITQQPANEDAAALADRLKRENQIN